MLKWSVIIILGFGTPHPKEYETAIVGSWLECLHAGVTALATTKRRDVAIKCVQRKLDIVEK